jgi:hypothetical protein
LKLKVKFRTSENSDKKMAINAEIRSATGKGAGDL